MSNTNPNANKVHIQVHTQFQVKNNYNITLLIKATIRSALSITYNSSVSLCVNSSGLVSILEELMKVFRISIFHIWNNQLILFLCIFIFFFVNFFIFFLSEGRAAAHIEQLGLVDGGGRAVQGLPAQGPARADGKVQQGREEGTSQSEGTKLYSLIVPYIF